MDFISIVGGLLASDIRMATPILLGALGLLIMNRAGLINIGCEGIMLIATFVAIAGTYYMHNVWLGMLCAMLVGALLGLLFAFLTVSLRANQVVVGVAFNTLGAGVSTVLYRMIFGMDFVSVKEYAFQRISIPVLKDIPLIGEALFNQMPVVYIAFLLVPVVSYFLFRTPTGLNLRSVGENPKAADTLGIDVYRMRYAATIVGCMLMAMGGAFLSTGLLNSFQEDMTANRGFIALAAVIFGRYKPTGVMLATLLFAFGLAVANLLPSINSPIPYNFVTMIPYILTIVVLAGFAGKTVAPAAAGKPYKKG
ncbi:MAG: ABC transporter permease [Clostridiales bacterium]|nr:ABC transporter permease [Clostridiales bacterium]MDY4180148.1 ABC transporter permease [Pseudoflavonifractor sp.]